MSSNMIGFFSIEAEVRTTQNERLGHRQIALDREDAIVDHLAMVIWEEDKTTQSNRRAFCMRMRESAERQ